MSEDVVVKVGQRGEVYTTAELRRKVGLVPGAEAVVKVEGAALIIRAKPTALDLLRKKRIKAEPVKAEALSKLRRELALEVENR